MKLKTYEIPVVQYHEGFIEVTATNLKEACNKASELLMGDHFECGYPFDDVYPDYEVGNVKIHTPIGENTYLVRD